LADAWKTRRSHGRFGLGLLLLTLSVCVGCSQVTVAVRLKQAQDLFNQASRLTVLDENYRDYIEEAGAQPSRVDRKTIPSLTEDARAKYQLVLDLLKRDVLTSEELHPELRINAYALKAFAEWRLKQHKNAITTAAEGERLCASLGDRNPRDCGMLMIAGGLVVNSETLERFEEIQKGRQGGNLTKEEATELVKQFELALDKLGELSYPPDDPIAIYANQQKLIVLGNILDMWNAYSRSETQRERAEAIERASRICQEFPQDYPSAELTKELARKRLGLLRCESSPESP